MDWERMTAEQKVCLISIAEDFIKWLEKTANKYGVDKDTLQSLIKQLL